MTLARPVMVLCLAAGFAASPWPVPRLLADPVLPEGGLKFEEHVRPLLTKYCTVCHNNEKQKGDLNLVPFLDRGNLSADRKVWERVVEQIESREMPPSKRPQPPEDSRELVLKFIDGNLSVADCTGPKNPGRVTIRRLNREEYHNTIRDLLGVDFWPEEFPNDEVGYGFDNIGDVLSLSPMLMEKYLAAAETITAKAINASAVPKPFTLRLKGDAFASRSEHIRQMETGVLGMYREGAATAKIDVPRKGGYTLRVRASGEQAGPEAPKMRVSIGDREIATVSVPNRQVRTFDTAVPLEAGAQMLSIAYLNNYNDPSNRDPKLRGDRNLFIEAVEIVGPPGEEPAVSESHRRLIPRHPEPGAELAAAREFLATFARRAYRRPVSAEEVERLSRFVALALEKRANFLEGMQLAVQAVLCSPHFLYRWELDPPGLKPGDVRGLTDLEIASRLSYFLWNSMPDEPLMALAERGELTRDGNVEKQAARMLADWRAQSFLDSFVAQWLQIRGIWEVAIDPGSFPRWHEELKGSMKEEAELFFREIARADRPVADVLDADFTFVNEKLARHYGIAGVQGAQMQRVSLPADSPRGGVLTLGSVLVSTSNPTRTSPVIRGKWILEQILGTPPPAPPPDVPPLQEQNAVDQTASLRKRLEDHRSRAECASCHNRMDPLGFALENFDATGAWRDQDGKFPIDASGKLPNGTKFGGAIDLKAVLKHNDKFVRGFTEKLMIYALGRGLDYYDSCAVAEIIKKAGGREARFGALVAGIVTSDPFLKRKAPEVAAQ